jgi:hypothetical protein
MILQSTYFTNWQNTRIEFILSKYSADFFKGKRILELGAYNGYIGAYFSTLGADVHCIEGRPENVENIKNDYPNVTAEVGNLDTPEWTWGHYDIIINFGLYYHLENFHKAHLTNCINNCDLMFFESVIYDSFESEIYFRDEDGIDQSISMKGGTPSTSYVEDIFVESGILYEKFTDSNLNAGHHYDWVDTNSKKLDEYARRFWIVKTKK